MGNTAPTVSNEWEAQYDCDTLQRAKEVMDSPERMSRAQAYARKKAADLQKLAGKSSHSDADEALSKGYRTIK